MQNNAACTIDARFAALSEGNLFHLNLEAKLPLFLAHSTSCNVKFSKSQKPDRRR